MNHDVALLKDSLAELTRAYRSLIPLFHAERESLQTRDAKGIEANAIKIGAALHALAEQDRSRQEITLRLGRALGIGEENLSLSALDQALGGNTDLMALRKGLQEATAELDRVNRENRAILEGLQLATDEILSGVVKANRQQNTYNRQGGRYGGAGGGFLSKHL